MTSKPRFDADTIDGSDSDGSEDDDDKSIKGKGKGKSKDKKTRSSKACSSSPSLPVPSLRPLTPPPHQVTSEDPLGRCFRRPRRAPVATRTVAGRNEIGRLTAVFIVAVERANASASESPRPGRTVPG